MGLTIPRELNIGPGIGVDIEPGNGKIAVQAIDLEAKLQTDLLPIRAIVGINVTNKKVITIFSELAKNRLIDGIARVFSLGKQIQADRTTRRRKSGGKIRQLRFQRIETGLIKK
ncbi:MULTISPECIES: hypothetical protein [unclassified Janthinobacterium]|uniref:hypothetical protein n=1 Tax=unclassified Janthinobacterium TaxID=2610881 RepID=UPI0015877E2F|nr:MULTISPECIES: hypothetical protein [unclassified Janthinobacterium]